MLQSESRYNGSGIIMSKAKAKTAAKKPVLRKPERFNVEKGQKVARRVIHENQTWLEEMAKR